MNDQPKPDAIASDRLVKKLLASINANKTEVVAGYGLIQGNLAHCSAQALITILRHKGIISEHELARALADEYNRRTDSLEHRSIIVNQGPVVAPKGN